MKRIICLLMCICMMTIHVYAERSAYEEAIELLHCDAPYMHTVSYEAMRA